jgi:flotillin
VRTARRGGGGLVMALLPWIIGIVVAVVVVLFVSLWLFNYRKVGPNQVLVVSGRTSTVEEADGRRRKVGYRLQVGGGTFVLPFVETLDVLPIEVFSLAVRCPEVLTAQGVIISAEASGQVKAAGDEPLLHRAVENFLSRGSSGITAVAQEVLEGHMRAALGRMTVEEIYTERDAFAARVREAASTDFSRLGLELLSFSLRDISDAIMQAPAQRIAESTTPPWLSRGGPRLDDRASGTAQGDVARLQAEAELASATRDFEMQRASFQADVNVRRAKADIAYELERARLAEELKRQEYQVRLAEKEMAARVEEQEIARREKELEASVKRPAEAMNPGQAEAESDAYRRSST